MDIDRFWARFNVSDRDHVVVQMKSQTSERWHQHHARAKFANTDGCQLEPRLTGAIPEPKTTSLRGWKMPTWKQIPNAKSPKQGESETSSPWNGQTCYSR